MYLDHHFRGARSYDNMTHYFCRLLPAIQPENTQQEEHTNGPLLVLEGELGLRPITNMKGDASIGVLLSRRYSVTIVQTVLS
jgi:hypothetical protein